MRFYDFHQHAGASEVFLEAWILRATSKMRFYALPQDSQCLGGVSGSPDPPGEDLQNACFFFP